MKEIPFSRDSKKTLKLFRKINKFKDLSDKELVNFVKYGKLCEYNPDELIIKEGDYDCWVHFLINGSLNVLKGDHKVSSLCRCGDVFGEMGVIDGSQRSASIVANSKVWLLSFDASVIEDKLKSGHTNFCYIIYRIFAEVLAVRLRHTTEENIKLRNEPERLQNELKILKSSISKKKPARNYSHSIDIKDEKILIVDSVESTRKIIRSILKDLGFKAIYEAYDGFHALNILEDDNIDLIISEWDLAKLSGLDLLKKVRSNPLKKETAFLMMLHESDKKLIDLAVNAKVSQCIMKPYSGNTVLEKIEAVLG